MSSPVDVIVVGGGLAGLVAAARAAELGLTVTVLEKGRGDRYPCNARYSGGVFHIAFTDIKSPPETLRAVIDKATGGAADAGQADALAVHGGRLIDWMRSQGAQYIRTQVAWQNFILAPPRPIVAGLEWQGRGPDVLLRRLTDKLRERGGALVLGARGRSIVMDGGRCAGVEAEVDGTIRRYPARAVVIADGGFQANLDMLKANIAPEPTGVKQRGAATGAGDGLRMAEAAGAEITALNRFYGHLLSRDAMTNDKVWPYPELDAIATAGLLVDRQGRRFADEGIGGVALANSIARSADPLGATIIFDAKIWDGPGKSARIPANPTLENAGGTILRAGSLAELAAKAGLSGDTLEETVAGYNDAIGKTAGAALNPPRTTARFAAHAIATAPYMAIPVCAGITYTMGGIRVNGSSQVLARSGAPIAGLYAAGSTTGGLEGGESAVYIGGLTKAGVQGLVAAEAIAQALQQRA